MLVPASAKTDPCAFLPSQEHSTTSPASASSLSGRRAAEKRDALAPFQLIELHSVHRQREPDAGYRIGSDQSAGMSGILQPHQRVAFISEVWSGSLDMAATNLDVRLVPILLQKSPRSDCGIEIRNNRIGGNGFLNQRCVSAPAFESIFLARRPKIFLQQNLPTTAICRSISATQQGGCEPHRFVSAPADRSPSIVRMASGPMS
jgi:hypothetical protein